MSNRARDGYLIPCPLLGILSYLQTSLGEVELTSSNCLFLPRRIPRPLPPTSARLFIYFPSTNSRESVNLYRASRREPSRAGFTDKREAHSDVVQPKKPITHAPIPSMESMIDRMAATIVNVFVVWLFFLFMILSGRSFMDRPPRVPLDFARCAAGRAGRFVASGATPKKPFLLLLKGRSFVKKTSSFLRPGLRRSRRGRVLHVAAASPSRGHDLPTSGTAKNMQDKLPEKL